MFTKKYMAQQTFYETFTALLYLFKGNGYLLSVNLFVFLWGSIAIVQCFKYIYSFHRKYMCVVSYF